MFGLLFVAFVVTVESRWVWVSPDVPRDAQQYDAPGWARAMAYKREGCDDDRDCTGSLQCDSGICVM